MKKSLKRITASLLTMATLACSLSASAWSLTTLDTYIPKTQSSSASESLTGHTGVFMMSFYVDDILNGDKDPCNYQRIKIKLTGTGANVAWLDGTGCEYVSGRGTKTMVIKARKDYYCEVATGQTSTNDVSNFSVYYYGNDPSLDAYAYMQDDWA